jgi:hypothetical protein
MVDRELTGLCCEEPPTIIKPVDVVPVRPVPDEDRMFTAGSNAEILLGRSVIINFTVTDRESGEYTVRWVLPDGSFLTPGESRDNITVSDETRFLTISNSQTANIGNYRLIVTDTIGSREVNTRLQVFTTPTVVSEIRDTIQVNGRRIAPDSDGNVRVDSGDTVSFRFVTKGTPAPDVGWRRINALRPGGDISITTTKGSDQTTSVLLLRNIDVSESGTYSVEGDNGAEPVARSSVNVIVRSPETVRILRAPAGSRPVVTSSSVYAIIGQDDVLVLRNQRLDIECSAVGNPTPVITWRRNGGSLPTGALVSASGTLEIADFRQNRHSGTYTCTADNTMTSDQEDIEVISPVRPQIVAREQPSLPSPPLPDADVSAYAGHIVRMVEGRRLTIDVEATGTPTPTIIWRLPSGDRIGPGQSVGRASVLPNNSLVLTDTRPSDSGTYRAIAKNAGGLAKAKTMLTVVGFPKVLSQVSDNTHVGVDVIAPSSTGDFVVPRGSMLVLEGSIRGVSSVVWTRDGDPLPVDSRVVVQSTQGASRLIIRDVRPSDSGIYMLYGENDAGRVDTSANIVVQGKGYYYYSVRSFKE